MRVITLITLVTLLASLAVTAINLEETLAPLAALVETSWIGYFTSTPAALFDHEIEWRAALNGHVVKWLKWVNDIDFTMETYFFWDAEAEVIAFTQLTSNGTHSRGSVESEDGKLVLVGSSLRSQGLVEFRQTFEIMPDGTLEDRYYTRGSSSWIPQHVIVYQRRSSETSTQECSEEE